MNKPGHMQSDFAEAMAEAVARQKAGDLEGAARLYRDLLAVAPDLVPALCLLANLERRLENWPAAAERLERARQLAPQAPAVLLESGLLALARGRPAEAVPLLQALVAAQPAYAEGWFNLAYALERSNQPEPALEAYQQALQHGLGQPWEAHNRIGSCLVVLGREQAADPYFDQALSASPDYPPALFGKGMVRMAYGDFDGARQLFESALQKDPDRIEVYQQLVELRKYEDPEDPLLARLQALLGKEGLSDYALEKLHFSLGKMANDRSDYDTAFEHYAKAKALKKLRQPPFDRNTFRDLADRICASFPELPARDANRVGDGPIPVFIVGMPRSGTTLIEQILSCHSEVGGAGELAFMESVSRRPDLHYPEGVAEQSSDWRQAVRESYLQTLEDSAGKARFITDKFPANFKHVGMIATLFPEALFIHSRRDPRDSGLSIFFQDFGMGNLYANDLDDIAFYFRGYEQLMHHWERLDQGRIYNADYEKLVADQEKATRQLLEFLGLDWEPACLRFHENPRKVSTMSRWQVRQPVYQASRERWRKFEKHLGPLAGLAPMAEQIV